MRAAFLLPTLLEGLVPFRLVSRFNGHHGRRASSSSVPGPPGRSWPNTQLVYPPQVNHHQPNATLPRQEGSDDDATKPDMADYELYVDADP